MLEITLFLIVLAVLILPIAVHKIEKNLELFLFVMGILSVTVTHILGSSPLWSMHLVKESFTEPVMITIAVLLSGFVLYFYGDAVTKYIVKIEKSIGSKLFCFFLVVLLGIISSVITAIMAAILLVEIVSALRLSRDYEIKLVVLGCFSIGLGAALTPIGEPLSTICISKLRGEPYNADFFFLLKNLGVYIFPGIIGLGVLGSIIERSEQNISQKDTLKEKEKSTIKDVFVYALKVYVFIMALVYLGTGFKPIIDEYVIKLSSHALYWINTVSAVLDNATLTAAEISPAMSLEQIKYVLMGLLISGGMLIPGNIPNIICAGRLNIKSREWAMIGLPLGFAAMLIYFGIFVLI